MTLHVLVGYDETAASRNALAYIASLARNGALDVAIVTAANRASTHQRLHELAAGVLGREPVQYRRDGTLYQALYDSAMAEKPDLVVYGEATRSWSRWTKFQRREPLYAILPMSSLLVRNTSRPGGKVLMCAGGDASILEDAEFTGRLLHTKEAHATILHVLSQMPLIFGSGSPRERVVESFAATGAPEMKHMQAAVDTLATNGIKAEIKIRIGLVVEQVSAELNEGGYDLLVIGAHRSKGLVERFLLEDVAANILGKNLGPVLVVKQTSR